jgi:hypothetical protein
MLSLWIWHKRSDHRSFKGMQDITGDSAALTRPTVLHRMAIQLFHIGWEKSAAVAGHWQRIRRGDGGR